VNRTDRLFDLIQILRDGRLHRAADMAARLGVSVRTIWRDMATLMASGLPIEGERGVGYMLRAPITLPPMVLTADELEALRLGMRLVAQAEDPGLARAARSLAGKIAAVLPTAAEPDPEDIFVFSAGDTTRAAPHLPAIRRALRARHRLAISYLETSGLETHRDIRPLALDHEGRVWTLAAWCEARADFRSFRLDRILMLTETYEAFPQEAGRGLEDFRARLAQG
jgi:predicted DNA-binding transcriptional regulator YafY